MQRLPELDRGLSVKAFKIKIPNYPAFTYLTSTPLEEIPEAVREKFGVMPESVETLNNS